MDSSGVSLSSTRALVDLPAEIVLSIAGYLVLRDLNALLQTARRYHAVLSSRLYELGIADVTQRPHIWAIKNQKIAVLRRLLERETYSIHAYRDYSGGTSPLHTAVLYHDEESLRLLLQHRTIVSPLDSKQQTPLTFAVEQDNEPAVRLLVEAGAGRDYDTTRGEWYRTLRPAAARAKEGIVRLLVESAMRDGFEPDDLVRTDVLEAAVDSGKFHILRLLHEHGWDLKGEGAFLEACERGELEMVKLFQQQWIEAGSENRHLGMALLEAVEHGQAEVVRYLLDAGADATYSRDDDGYTALHCAMAEPSVETVKALLAAGASPAAMNDDQATPLLHMMVHLEDDEVLLQILALLVDAGADVNARDWDGSNALSLAVQDNQVEVVRALLAAGADVNATYRDGSTALHYATNPKCPDVLQCLIEAGADINIAGRSGHTPLMWAIGHGKKETIVTLLDAGADITAVNDKGNTALHAAAKSPDAYKLELLIERGVDINTRGAGNRTALHYAAVAGASESIPLLLRAGIPVDAVDGEGGTALYVAAGGGDEDKVKELLQAGADPAARSTNLCTPLHRAKTVATAKCLIEAGADISFLDEGNHNPLHWAASSGYFDVLKFLIEGYENKGLDYLARCNEGRTFFEEGAMHGRLDIIKIAVEKGAALNPVLDGNPLWMSALHEATSRGWIETAEYLVTHGADPYYLDAYGRSALDWAGLEPQMKASMDRHCPESSNTDANERDAILKRSIAMLANRILAQGTQDAFYKLGKCLLFLGNMKYLDQARAALGRTSEISCDLCDKREMSVGGRWVCLWCEETDLCAECWLSYQEEDRWIGVCRGHPFIEIEEAHKEELADETTRKQWLEDIAAKFSS